MDNNLLIIPLIIGGILAVTLLNIYIAGSRIKVALRKFIIPALTKNGFKFVRSEPVELLGYGDFKSQNVDSGLSFIGLSNGSPRIEIYAYIFYEDLTSGDNKRMTVKIDTLFLFIRKVTYSDPALQHPVNSKI